MNEPMRTSLHAVSGYHLDVGDPAGDELFLGRAIELAEMARAEGEDPFGAVLVADGRIVGEARDRTIADVDPTAHAEILVIRELCRRSGRIDLPGYSLYSSAEPCAMCAGAIHWARISLVVFSVPQSELQRITGGAPKSPCEPIINAGRRKAIVRGGVLLERGLRVFEGYAFAAKADRVARRRQID
jgi:tRNA(Arg) A34 adenosine deaminase TadA